MPSKGLVFPLKLNDFSLIPNYRYSYLFQTKSACRSFLKSSVNGKPHYSLASLLWPVQRMLQMSRAALLSHHFSGWPPSPFSEKKATALTSSLKRVTLEESLRRPHSYRDWPAPLRFIPCVTLCLFLCLCFTYLFLQQVTNAIWGQDLQP